MMEPQQEGRPDFTPEQAWELYGKIVMVGFTYVNDSGNVIEQKQFHGEVIRANPSEGIVLKLADGTERTLPPDFRPFRKTKPGEYREQSTGEIVVDPDWLCSYTVRQRASSKSD